MADIHAQLENIDFKIKQLARKVELIKEENNQPVKENTQLRELLNAKEQKELIGKQAMVEFEGLAKNEKEEVKQMRDELDHYMNELDQCIQLLENV